MYTPDRVSIVLLKILHWYQHMTCVVIIESPVSPCVSWFAQ
jgi:hypothetical protein